MAEKPWEGYAQSLVTVENYRRIPDLIRQVEQAMPGMFPEAIVAGQKFMMGPGEPGKIRVRVIGPDGVCIDANTRGRSLDAAIRKG